MTAKVAVHSGGFGPGVGEVHCCGACKAAALVILDWVYSGDTGRGDGGCLGCGSAEDVNLALLAVTAGDVGQAHVVGEGVDDAALLGGEGGREDEGFAGVVVAEEEELRVELECLRVVQIYVWGRKSANYLTQGVQTVGSMGDTDLALSAEHRGRGRWLAAGVAAGAGGAAPRVGRVSHASRAQCVPAPAEEASFCIPRGVSGLAARIRLGAQSRLPFPPQS